MESAPLGSSCDGVGGARKRMKAANFSISLDTSRPVSPLLQPIELTEPETSDLVAFMETLTGEGQDARRSR
jgi:hypothetical protein